MCVRAHVHMVVTPQGESCVPHWWWPGVLQAASERERARVVHVIAVVTSAQSRVAVLGLLLFLTDSGRRPGLSGYKWI